MQNSKINGGEMHRKYGHFYFPRVVQVVCPHCKKPSSLTNINAPEDVEFFIDTAHYELAWIFKCNFCINKREVSWAETKEMDLLVKINIREENIWAWNSNHLDYLISLLSNNEKTNHQWAFYKNYVNKNWFKKTKNKADLQKLLKLYEETKLLKT